MKSWESGQRIIRNALTRGMSESQKAQAREYSGRAMQQIRKGLGKMGNEAHETKEMAKSFFQLLECRLQIQDRHEPPGEEEVRIALEQLKDVGRLSVFTTAVILPGGAISLMGLELLARKFGINFTFVPSSFRKNADWKHPDGRKRKTKSNLNRGGEISTVRPLDDNE